MPLIVNTNIPSLVAQRYLNQNDAAVNRSFTRLSSGYRINEARDDAAGLAIGTKIESAVRGLQKAQQNAQDGVSILQIAEGSLTSMGDALQRIRELTVQAANDTNSSSQRGSLVQEIRQLTMEITRLANSTQFNNLTLLDGSLTSKRLQIGPNSDVVKNTFDISSALATATPKGLGLFPTGAASAVSAAKAAGSTAGYTSSTTISFANGSEARAFLVDIDKALDKVNSRRSLIGAYQNKIDSIVNNIQLSIENFNASLSRIRDLDIASETATLTRNQVLKQSSISILSQANQSAQSVLSLLQGH